MCKIIQMRQKPKSKARLAEEKLVELWNKIGIASLILRDGRQVKVHDGRFVITMSRPVQSRSMESDDECLSSAKFEQMSSLERLLKQE